MVATPPGDYSSQHALLSAHGRLPGGEVWSAGLRTIATTLTAETIQNYADEVALAWAAFWSPATGIGLDQCNPTTAFFDGVTVRQISVTGVTQFLAEGAPPAPLPGLGATGFPDQLALAISLITPLAGRHGKGRFYVPLLYPTMAAGGRLNTAFAAGLAASASNLIQMLNGSMEIPNGADPGFPMHRIGVQSRTNPGFAAPPVVEIRVGDVIDTIRRRRNKLREAYSSNSVPTP